MRDSIGKSAQKVSPDAWGMQEAGSILKHLVPFRTPFEPVFGLLAAVVVSS